jgi:hypothetical protein
LRRREKRIAIAEEKRRWQVLYYTRDGKPDKNRRPGRPWTQSVFAGPEKAIYSGGVGVDLLANTRKMKKTGSVKSVSNTINQISLQTYLDEVQLYEHLLDPLTSIMQNTMGGGGPSGPAGAGQSLSQRGWGPEGDKMEPALVGIGALPDDWAEQQRRHRKNDMPSAPGTALNTARQQGSAYNSAYNSVSNSGDNTARSALSASSYSSSASKPRSILRKKSAYGTAGSSMGNSRHSTAKKSILVSRLETIHDDFSSVQSDSLLSGGDGQLDEPLSSLAFDTSKFEEFSSVADMFQHSSRVRRKNAKKVTYLPSQESFSSSYRSNIRNISAANFATQVARGIEQSGRLDVNGSGTRGGGSPTRYAGSSSGTPLGAYTGNTSGTTSPVRNANNSGVGMNFSRSMPLVPHLSQISEIVPIMSNTATRSVAATVASRSSRDAAAAAAKKKTSRERERNSSTIPWELLDSLDGERTRFNNERAHIDFHSKLK